MQLDQVFFSQHFNPIKLIRFTALRVKRSDQIKADTVQLLTETSRQNVSKPLQMPERTAGPELF